MLKPAGFCRGSPGMGAFWFQLFETGSYSQKSDIHPIVRSTPPLKPPPIYPLFPILIPIADALPSAGKSAFCDQALVEVCLLYTSDAADEEDSVDLGGRRIIKKT